MEIKENQYGYSLIEVLIAILIMGLVSLGIFALLPSGYTQTTNAGRLSIMSHYGQQKMDQLRALGVTSSDLAIGSHPAIPEFPVPGDRYSVRWVVANYPPLPNTRSVQVEVGYNMYESDGTPIPNNEGLNKSLYTFRTYITED